MRAIRRWPATRRASPKRRNGATRLRTHWPRYAIIEVTQQLVELAGEFADTFSLRGYDSVQLAAARTVQQVQDEELHFACFGTRLKKTAKVLGMLTGVA